MYDGVKMFGSNGREYHKPHAFVSVVGVPDVIRSAINGDVVTSSNKACCKLLSEGLEPAVVCRNAAGSDDGQFHGAAIIDYARESTRMNSLVQHFTEQLPEALALLEKMVSMESPSFDKELTDRFVVFLGSKFQEIGGKVEFAPAEKVGNHLHVKFSLGSADPILLLGHTDTVWPAGEVAKRPFKIENGRATGPGVFDMKAGILLMWMALRVLKDRPVTVLLTSDEEIGSTSSRALIESEASRCRAIFVLEPSLPGGALKTARKGIGRFTVKAIGRAAHAGIDPEKGVNAIEEIARQILKLQTMSDAGRGTTVTVGVVQGGTRSNVVPAEAT